MADILMTLRTAEVEKDILVNAPDDAWLETKERTHFCTTREFEANEVLYRQFSDLLWKPERFHTRGLHAAISRKTDFNVTGYDRDGNPAGFVMVVTVGSKWLIEYVMVEPEREGQRVASHMTRRILQEGTIRGAKFFILNCDPEKEGGKLVGFYERFGFKQAP